MNRFNNASVEYPGEAGSNPGEIQSLDRQPMHDASPPPEAQLLTVPHSFRRDSVTAYRIAFRLEAAPPDAAWLHLFADTRYRLLVNGKVVCHGPARFVAGFPQFDSVNIGPWLQSGANAIGLLVSSFHHHTFLSDPADGGLIAWGTIGQEGPDAVSLHTDDRWKVRLLPEYNQVTMPDLSFAVGPGEWLDGRGAEPWTDPDFDDSGWDAATAADATPWETLTPRSIPMLDEREQLPERIVGLFRIDPEPDAATWCASIHPPGRGPEMMGNPRSGLYALRGYLHSDRATQVSLRSGQGTVFLNGHKLPGSRESADVPLQAGWNELIVVHALRRGVWEFALALPPEYAGCLFSEADNASTPGFRRFGPVPVDDWRAFRDTMREATSASDLIGDPEWGATIPANQPLLPMLQREWDHLQLVGGDAAIDFRGDWKPGDLVPEADSQTILIDFEREVLGRPRIELTAPEGVTIDLTYTEQLDDGKAVPWYQTTRMAERYVTREGRQTWHLLHPRGLRYLELIVRGSSQDVTIHRLSLTGAQYPVRRVGDFRCADKRLNEIWTMGRETQAICMEDGFLDCPWRERGVYAGDILVQYYTNLACFGDHELMPFSVGLFFQAQHESGLLPGIPHGLSHSTTVDYSAIALQAVRHCWSVTGDPSLAIEQRQRILKLLDGFRSIRIADSLLVETGAHGAYVDIPRSRHDKEGVSCALNAFVQRAFRESATLFAALGEPDRARELDAEADRIAAAMRDAFVDGETGLFLDRRPGDVDQPAPSVMGNALAVLYGIASEEGSPKIARWIADQLADNFYEGNPNESGVFRCSPYFSFYALDVLFQYGLVDEALGYIRTCWGHMIDHGAWTCWEFFQQVCSLCHAWASSPTHYLSTRVLGIRPENQGDPDRFIFDPHPGSLTWAEGAYPHAKGAIHVRWETDSTGAIRYAIEKPEAVTVDVADNPRLVEGLLR